MARVACVGIATIDLHMTVDSLPRGEGKLLASSFEERIGGVAANAAIVAARLGGDVRLISAVGDDPAADRIVDALTALGVDAAGVQRVEAVGSAVSFVLVDQTGERLVVNHTDDALFDRADTAGAASLAETAAVLVDCRWPAAARAALEGARVAGVAGIVDLDRCLDGTHAALLPSATHVIASVEGLRATTDIRDVDDALAALAARTDAWVAVTLGREGTRWLDGNRRGSEPAVDVVAVDTNGAGDTFHGAFALRLAEGATESEAVRFASAAAGAMCATGRGPSALPPRTAIDDLLDAGVDA